MTIAALTAVLTLGTAVAVWADVGYVEPLIPPVQSSQGTQQWYGCNAAAKCSNLKCSKVSGVFSNGNWTFKYSGVVEVTAGSSANPPKRYGKFVSDLSPYGRCSSVAKKDPPQDPIPTCGNNNTTNCGQFQVHSNSTCSAPTGFNGNGYIKRCL